MPPLVRVPDFIRAARQALASPGDMPDVCLRSSAVKYLRDNISAEQLHSSILQTVQGAKADAVVGKMSKSMPEGKVSRPILGRKPLKYID